MNYEILKIKLDLRLEELECASKIDLIAGLLDSNELEQIKGRIKELKTIIKGIESLNHVFAKEIELVCTGHTNDE